MTASAPTRLRDLVLAKLSGRKIDIVGFIDELLELAKDLGAIHCFFVAEDSLRFEIADLGPCDVQLEAARGKLRMLCARLSFLCNKASPPVSPYEGEGTIQKTASFLAGNGKVSDRQELAQWTARFKNTPSQQEFTIAPVKVPSATSAPT